MLSIKNVLESVKLTINVKTCNIYYYIKECLDENKFKNEPF